MLLQLLRTGPTATEEDVRAESDAARMISSLNEILASLGFDPTEDSAPASDSDAESACRGVARLSRASEDLGERVIGPSPDRARLAAPLRSDTIPRGVATAQAPAVEPYDPPSLRPGSEDARDDRASGDTAESPPSQPRALTRDAAVGSGRVPPHTLTRDAAVGSARIDTHWDAPGASHRASEAATEDARENSAGVTAAADTVANGTGEDAAPRQGTLEAAEALLRSVLRATAADADDTDDTGPDDSRDGSASEDARATRAAPRAWPGSAAAAPAGTRVVWPASSEDTASSLSDAPRRRPMAGARPRPGEETPADVSDVSGASAASGSVATSGGDLPEDIAATLRGLGIRMGSAVLGKEESEAAEQLPR